MNDGHLREIAILPCLPKGMSIEDQMLVRTSPVFGLEHALPNAALAAMLSFINVSKSHFLELVLNRRGIDLLSTQPQGDSDGPYRYRPEHAAAYANLEVEHDPARTPLISDADLVEIFDNASSGGQLAIAGYITTDLPIPTDAAAVQLTGCFQIGIIDYLWGSGHTVTFHGTLTVDLTSGQIGDHPGYSYGDVCDFVVDYFRFSSVTACAALGSDRFIDNRGFVGAAAA